jgi:hypothetical protein
MAWPSCWRLGERVGRPIPDRGADAVGDHIVLDLAEPDLHVMQPSTIRRRDMEWHVGMRGHDAATALA